MLRQYQRLVLVFSPQMSYFIEKFYNTVFVSFFPNFFLKIVTRNAFIPTIEFRKCGGGGGGERARPHCFLFSVVCFSGNFCPIQMIGDNYILPMRLLLVPFFSVLTLPDIFPSKSGK